MRVLTTENGLRKGCLPKGKVLPKKAENTPAKKTHPGWGGPSIQGSMMGGIATKKKNCQQSLENKPKPN
jgi:hypothetical protein